MGKSTLHHALLFSKELGPQPYKYRLYFAVQEPGAQPQIHRLYVLRAQKFHQLTLGGIYHVEHSGVRLCRAEHLSTENLSDSQYLRLVDLRDLQFMSDREAKRFGIFSEDYDPSALYYSYKTYKSLVEYNPSFGVKLSVYLLKMLGYIFSFFIPMGLYLLFIYTLSLIGGDNSSRLHAIALPLAAFLTLPMVFWMINTLHSLIDTCLLSFPSVRAYMLHGYALRWGGFKKNITLSPEHRRHYAVFGTVSLGLLLAGLLLVFITL